MKMEAQPVQDLLTRDSEGRGKDSAAARILDELGHPSGNVKDFRPSAIDSGYRVKDLLPPLFIEQSERKVSSVNVGPDLPLHGYGSAAEQMLPGGDSLSLAKGYQSLGLAGGDRISVNSSGDVTMVDANGRVATMTEKRTTPPDMMPSLVMGEFSNGVRLTSAGGLNVLTYPDGTRVYLDRTGLRAVDRENQPRVQLDLKRPDFDFIAFK
ncbi:hypothetical protein KBI23_21335 [bacterium]|nr:hypothetical protein [bacterium]MBP9811117.1 hypothetical protein [bacterium]